MQPFCVVIKNLYRHVCIHSFCYQYQFQKAGIHIYLFVVIQIYEIPAYFYISTKHLSDEPY